MVLDSGTRAYVMRPTIVGPAPPAPAVTVIDCVVEAEAPCASCTVRRTVNVPAVAKVCAGVLPPTVSVPSPKSQV